MREFQVENVKGELEIGNIRVIDLLAEPENKIKNDGITPEEFHAILDKASQPVKKEDKPKTSK